MVVIAVVSALALAGCSGNHKSQNFRVAITSNNGVSGFSIGTITVTQGNRVNI